MSRLFLKYRVLLFFLLVGGVYLAIIFTKQFFIASWSLKQVSHISILQIKHKNAGFSLETSAGRKVLHLHFLLCLFHHPNLNAGDRRYVFIFLIIFFITRVMPVSYIARRLHFFFFGLYFHCFIIRGVSIFRLAEKVVSMIVCLFNRATRVYSCSSFSSSFVSFLSLDNDMSPFFGGKNQLIRWLSLHFLLN